MAHQIISSRVAIGLGALLLPLACFAHPGHNLHPGFIAGMAHPFGGLDHLLAMIAVGLWAAQLGGRALWALPTAFVAVMVFGAAAGIAGVAINGVEPMIVASVLALGLLMVLFARVSVVSGSLIVATFAFFHGFAHGVELPPGASAVSYTAGLMIATALLHLAGIAIAGMSMSRQSWSSTRWAGALVLLGGVTLLY
jgi:urease accessory protein